VTTCNEADGNTDVWFGLGVTRREWVGCLLSFVSMFLWAELNYIIISGAEGSMGE
jgi:hypothetical protein